MSKDDELIFISVIVICFNEELYLEKCLVALLDQDYPRDRFEIILIDNGSTDRSVEIGKKYADIVEVRPGIKVGALRNIGVQLTKGSIVSFLDGDCEARRDWLRTINSLNLIYPNTVNGALCHLDSSKNWIAQAWFCLNRVGRIRTLSLGASNVSMAKFIFEEFGGFNESLTTGEDAELFNRIDLRYPVMYDSSLVVIHHGVPLTIKSFVSREIWHGLGAFGSFKINLFDKPLIATIIFFTSAILIILGLFSVAFNGSYFMLSLGIFLFLMIILMTLILRLRFIRSYLHGLQLAILFMLYYSARSISLMKLFLGYNQSYYSRDRD